MPTLPRVQPSMEDLRDQRLDPAYAERIAQDPRFNTQLNPSEEPAFQAWKTQNSPNDSGWDYDLRGAFKAGLKRDPVSGHLDDQFKKPNHATFSTFSRYAPAMPELAGSWQGDTYVPPTMPVPEPRPDLFGGQDQSQLSGGAQDDMGLSYGSDVQRRQADQAAGWMRGLGSNPPTQPPPTTDAAATEPAAPPTPPAKPAKPGEKAYVPPAPPQVHEPAGDSRIMRVLHDVGGGIRESGPAIVTGARDAIQEALDVTNAIADWSGQKLGISPEELKQGDITLPDPRKLFGTTKTVTGDIIQKTTQFVTGFAIAGKELEAVGLAGKLSSSVVGRLGYEALKSGLTGAEFFDGQEAKLGDILKSFGVPDQVLPDLLKTDPSDSEALGRFKNAISQVIPGLALDGLVLGVQALRAGRAARKAVDPTAPPAPPGAPPELPPGTPLVSAQDLMALGDPSKPRVSRVSAAAPTDQFLGHPAPATVTATDTTGLGVSDSLLAKAASKTALDLGVPDDVVARAIAGAAQEARGAGAPPPPAPGTVRLYRGEGGKDAQPFIAESPMTGRWFTTDAEEAAQYAKDNNGKVSYVDLTRNDLMGAASGATAPDRHFLLDANLAGRMQPLEQQAGARATRFTPPLARQQAAEDRLMINFSRINSPDDIQAVIDDMVQAYRPDIDKMRRGVRSFDIVKLDAAHEDAFQILAKRRVGQPLSDAETTAVRQLFATGHEKLLELSLKAAQTGSDADLFNMRRMVNVQNAINATVLGARADAARSFGAWRIPAGSDAVRSREVARMLDEWGGKEPTREMAAQLAMLSSNPVALQKYLQGSWWRKAGAGLWQVYVNAMLSNPVTHIANIVGNLSVPLMQMYETATARRIAQVMGDDMGVQGGELLAQMKGLIEGGGMDGLRFAWKNLKAGEALPLDPNAVARSKVGQLGKAWSADTWGASQNGIVGKSLDVFNFFSTLPGRSLVGADAYFKSIGYRMGLRQWAARTAGQEAASGKIRPDMLKGREAQLLADPPPEMLEAGRLNADYQTFNNTPGRFATWINLGRQWFPGMNLLMPFVRTPANIMNYALGQRTPLALFTRQLYADMAAGGARAEIAAARLSTGTMIANLAYNAALNGWVTGKGPDDQNMAAAYRRIGRQPYSIRNADGRWFSFSRTDPAGVTLGQAADLAELLHNTDFDPKDTKSIESVIDAYIGAAINQTMNKSYLSSFSQFMEFTQSASTHFSTYMLGGLVPAGVAQAARGMDPVQREVDGAIDNLKARTPGLSQTLPPRLDMWGRPMSYQSGIGWAWDLFSPVYSRKENPEPIDRQIIMHDWSIPEPSKTMQFPGSVSINLGNYPHVWSYWKHMQGQDPGPTGHNLIDTLNGMVLGMGDIPEASAYAMRTTDGANSGKEQMVKQVIADFRQRATLGLINTPLNQVPRAVQGELTQLRAEYRRKVSQRPGTLIGVPPPPVRGVPMENQLP